MPVRTCAGCRQKADPADMLRLVAGGDGTVLVDYRRRLPGRGAWVMPVRACVERLEARPGALARALRAQPIRTAGLLDRVRRANLAALEPSLGLAARAGLLRGGGRRVREALARPQATALLLASDASGRLCSELRRRAGDLPVFVVPWDRERLGRLIGKGPRAALVLGRGGPSRLLIRELHRLEDLR